LSGSMKTEPHGIVDMVEIQASQTLCGRYRRPVPGRTANYGVKLLSANCGRRAVSAGWRVCQDGHWAFTLVKLFAWPTAAGIADMGRRSPRPTGHVGRAICPARLRLDSHKAYAPGYVWQGESNKERCFQF